MFLSIVLPLITIPEKLFLTRIRYVIAEQIKNYYVNRFEKNLSYFVFNVKYWIIISTINSSR